MKINTARLLYCTLAAAALCIQGCGSGNGGSTYSNASPPPASMELKSSANNLSNSSAGTTGGDTLPLAGLSTGLESGDDGILPVTSLTLQKPVVMLYQPAGRSIKVGGSASFTLAASGDGLNFSWTKDGIPLNETGSTLTLSNATLEDGATYGCKAYNSISSVNCMPFRLTVVGQLAISKQPASRTGYEDQPLTLSVAVQGGYYPSVDWYKGEKLIARDQFALAFDGLDMRDAGNYSCVVSDRTGNRINCATASISVKEKVRILEPFNNQIITEGEDISLAVVASGEPPLVYKCYKNGETILHTDDLSQLVIKDATPEDSGSYQCKAYNEGSKALTNSGEVTVVSSAPPPSHLDVELSWNEPTNREDGRTLRTSEIKSYNVHASRNENGPFNVVANTSGGATRIVFNDVKIGETYYIGITTTDIDGRKSAMSDVIEVRVQ